MKKNTSFETIVNWTIILITVKTRNKLLEFVPLYFWMWLNVFNLNKMQQIVIALPSWINKTNITSWKLFWFTRSFYNCFVCVGRAQVKSFFCHCSNIWEVMNRSLLLLIIDLLHCQLLFKGSCNSKCNPKLEEETL